MSGEFVWATVTAIAPLRVKLDGDTVSLPFLPDALVDTGALAVNDRVRCERKDRRVVIHGRAGGVVLPASDTSAGVVELATNAETQAGVDSSRAVTPASLASLSATDARRGLVELATNSETQAGVDTSRAVTPRSLAAHLGMVKARASGTVAVAATGTTTVTFPASRFATAPIVVASVVESGGVVAVCWISSVPTTSSFTVRVYANGGAQRAGTVHWMAEED